MLTALAYPMVIVFMALIMAKRLSAMVALMYRSELRIGFPMASLNILFPNLYPEAATAALEWLAAARERTRRAGTATQWNEQPWFPRVDAA